MSKAELTRRYIIEKSAPIFNMKGYAGTSLSDLIEATNLTKGSIYGNFENKDEVALEVYHYHVSDLNRRISGFMNDHKSMGDKLRSLTEYYRVNWKSIFTHGGCPILNAAVEADDNALFLKKAVQGSLDKWSKRLATIIESGQNNGEFKKDIAAEKYAYTILTILEGGMMMGKIMNSQKLLFSALERIDLIIKEEIEK